MENNKTSIAKIDEATKALGVVNNIPEIIKWRSMAEGFVSAITKEYKIAQNMQDGIDDKNIAYGAATKAGEFRLNVEARLGELIKIEQEAGRLAAQDTGRPKKCDTNVTLLKDIGLTRKDSERAQEIFDYKDLIPQVVASALKTKDIPTKQSLHRMIMDIKRNKLRDADAEAVQQVEPLPDQQFSTIIIDPPWDRGDEGDIEQLGRAQPTYKTMRLEEIAGLPIGNISQDNCHLYLWITNRSLPKGFKLFEVWGFRFITLLTWCKPSYGMGNYFRGQTEHIMFGVKGALALLRRDIGTCFYYPRGTGGHSSKPDQIFQDLTTCSPTPRLEMFSRKKHPGWLSWGRMNEQ